MGFAKTVFKQKSKENTSLFDEISEGILLSNPKKRFCVTLFLPIMDIVSCQLINRFRGMKSVMTSYQVLEKSFQSNASHLNLEVEARKFSNNFIITSLRYFLAKCSPSKRCLKKRLHIKNLLQK